MTSTRQHMVETAVMLFQRDGYHATTWRGLVKESGTPWGSVSHHFPGGKSQLAVEAIRLGADTVDALLDRCFTTTSDPAGAVARWFALSGDRTVATDYTTGCPVATIVLEMMATPGEIRDEATRALTRWQATLTRHLAAAGIDDAEATATTILALFEGALLLARARRDRGPLDVAAAQADRLLTTHARPG